MDRYTITLKSQSLKFSRMLVQRQWKHDNSELHNTDTFLEIWDGGSRRYERWPDGKECCWEVVSVDSPVSPVSPVYSLVEVLRELPSWNTPADIMWYEKVAVHSLENGFQIPGWSVTQTVLKSPQLSRPDNLHEPRRPNLHGPHRPIHARQPEGLKHNVNRRHFHNKKPHMGSGPLDKKMDMPR